MLVGNAQATWLQEWNFRSSFRWDLIVPAATALLFTHILFNLGRSDKITSSQTPLEELIKNNECVVVKCSITGCIPCKYYNADFERAKKEYPTCAVNKKQISITYANAHDEDDFLMNTIFNHSPQR